MFVLKPHDSAALLFRLIKIKEWVDKNDPGAIIIPFSGAFENRLLEMSEEERKQYLEDVKATG
jgi:obg-like ATPase 1